MLNESVTTHRRLMNIKDACAYLGMGRTMFNRDVRPHLVEIRLGNRTISFDVVDLDHWITNIKQQQGISENQKVSKWHEKHRGYTSATVYGTLTKSSEEDAFAKALSKVTTKRQK